MLGGEPSDGSLGAAPCAAQDLRVGRSEPSDAAARGAQVPLPHRPSGRIMPPRKLDLAEIALHFDKAIEVAAGT